VNKVKYWRIIIFAAVFIFCLSPIITAAKEAPKLSVELLSPIEVKGYPGIEQMVKANITNVSDSALPDVMAYITMADIHKHMTVNLEDYSADKPIVIGSLKPQETRQVELPVRFVYTSSFFLYVTAVSTQLHAIQSSDAIPIEIISNSSMDVQALTFVTFGMPVLLLIAMIGIILYRRRKWRIV
jgi:hypothetical protein